jgi:hypothetical protein
MTDFGGIGTAPSLATRLYGEAKLAAILATELVAASRKISCLWMLRERAQAGAP